MPRCYRVGPHIRVFVERVAIGAIAFSAVLLSLPGPASAAAVSRIPGVAAPDHVVIVIEENHAYSQIIGSSSAPYINSLANQGALFTQSFAVTHPSEPNYLALFSGSTQGLTDDSCPHTYSGGNLASGLIGAGLTFSGYSEDLPSTGSTVCDSGQYARKHNPWVNFTNVPAADNQPFTKFPSTFSALPVVSIVVPNQDNDMHDGTVATGDAWLKAHLDAYVQWAKTHNSLFIFTVDEDDDSQGNHIATFFVGPMVKTGRYSERITHYNVLRTLEDLYGLPLTGSAASAAAITDVWATTATPTPSPTPGATATATPTATPTSCSSCGFVEITPPASAVTASTSDGNLPGNAVDNSLSTRWSANGDGQWIALDLGSVRTLSHVTLAAYNGNSRQSRFDLQVSTCCNSWTTVWSGMSSGTTAQEESYDFPDVSARYVRYLGHGNTVNAWNSVTEISLFAPSVPSPTPTPTATATPTSAPTATPTSTPTPISGPDIEITPAGTGVTASTNDGNVPANVVDNSLATRWSGSGDGSSMVFDLGTAQTVSYVKIAAYAGNLRRNRFDLQYSTCCGTWTTLLTGAQTSGSTTQEEMFDFPDVSARFIRYVGHGATLNAGGTSTWNSVTEVSLWQAGTP